MKRRCICCKHMFRPNRYHPNQDYCYKEQCQQKRRTTWQKNKLKTDSDYRKNQADAQALWKQKNPDYWKNYRRLHHPPNVEDNCHKQQQSPRKGSTPVFSQPQPDVAKMDVDLLRFTLVSGSYRLTQLNGFGVAKMDSAIVQLTVLEQVTKTG